GVLGQRIGDEVRTVLQRALPQRPEERVVDGDRRHLWVQRRTARLAHGFDVHQGVGGVAGTFEVNQRGLAAALGRQVLGPRQDRVDRKSTRLNSSHVKISYAVFCLKKKT